MSIAIDSKIKEATQAPSYEGLTDALKAAAYGTDKHWKYKDQNCCFTKECSEE